MIPALRGTKLSAGGGLHGTRGSTGGRKERRLSGALVVSEVALACLLLVTSTLLLRSVVSLLDVNLGFQPERAVAIRIDRSAGFDSDAEEIAHYATILDRVRVLPAVRAAGLSDIVPMGFNRRWDFDVDGVEEDHYPYIRVISEGYLDAMGLELVAGRDLAASDGAETGRVALIGEPVAEVMAPSPLDAIGRTFRSSGREYTVVGVVRGTRQLSPDQAPGLELFLSMRQLGGQSATHLVVRSDHPLGEVLTAVRTELAAVDPSLPLDEATVLRELVDATVAPRRFIATLLGAFAMFALCLASFGIYAVISYSVAQRRKEIGIQLAIGATRADVRARVVGRTLLLAGLGLVLGLVAALGAGRFLSGLLYGVTPADPASYLLVVSVLGVVAAVAGDVPARRAARTDPMAVLSEE